MLQYVADISSGITITWIISDVRRICLFQNNSPPGFFGFDTPLIIGGSTAWYKTAIRSTGILLLGASMVNGRDGDIVGRDHRPIFEKRRRVAALIALMHHLVSFPATSARRGVSRQHPNPRPPASIFRLRLERWRSCNPEVWRRAYQRHARHVELFQNWKAATEHCCLAPPLSHDATPLLCVITNLQKCPSVPNFQFFVDVLLV